MELNRQALADRSNIQSYRGGRFRVSGILLPGAAIVTPTQAVPWTATSVAGLSPEEIAAVVTQAKGLDVCLLGCGAATAQVPQALREALKAAGLTVDAMNTGAACRTFNVLVAEGRAVMAALLPAQ